MTSSAADNLTRDKIEQLLAAVGSRTDEETKQPEVSEHNWRQPYCFNSEEFEKINEFARQTAEVIAQKFTDICHGSFNASITSVTQHFAAEFLRQLAESEQKNYYLAFGPNQNNLTALVGIPIPSAVSWITQLLGDSESESDTNRTLSQLEESLLWDISTAVVEAISQVHSGYEFHSDKKVVTEELPVALPGTEQLCKIDFRIEEADSEKSSEAYILTPGYLLDTIAGKTAETNKVFSAEQVSNAMLKHIQEVPVRVEAQLGSAMLTFEEIMNLSSSDIMLLDKTIDEPAALFVEGIERFQCLPAKSNGKYAIVITTRLSNSTENVKAE